MKPSKTVLFIPGFGEELGSRDYPALLKIYEQAGYVVRFVPLKWSRTTIDRWVEEFNQVYAEYQPSETILAGFSFGAVTAFMAASERVPSQLWLYSLSPYFKGDRPKKSWVSFIGSRRVRTFAAIDFDSRANQITCGAKVFYGDLEGEILASRASAAVGALPKGQLIKVLGAGHDATHPNYLAAIQQSV